MRNAGPVLAAVRAFIWCEGSDDTIVKKLFKTGFFHIFGSSVINKCLGFISSTVLVWLLSKSEYGRFTYAWNIYSIVIILNGLGADSAILQLCSEKSGDELYMRQVVRYGTRYGSCVSIGMGILLILVSRFVSMKIQGANDMLLLLCALPLLQFFYNVSVVCLRAQKRNQDFSRISMLNTVLHLLFSVIGAFAFREKGLVLGYYASYLLSSAICIFKMKICPFDSGRVELEQKERKAMLSISVVSACTNGLSQVMYLLDLFVLGIVAAEETVLASYRVGTIIPSALSFIPTALAIYLYPYFAEHRNDAAWCLRTYQKTVLAFGAFNLLLSGFLVFAAPLVIRIVYGSQYADVVPIFRLLALNYFFSATFRTLAGNLLTTQRKLKFNLLVGVIASVTNVAADFFFIQWWGSMGAALATVLVTLLSGALYTAYLFHVFRAGQNSAARAS